MSGLVGRDRAWVCDCRTEEFGDTPFLHVYLERRFRDDPAHVEEVKSEMRTLVEPFLRTRLSDPEKGARAIDKFTAVWLKNFHQGDAAWRRWKVRL